MNQIEARRGIPDSVKERFALEAVEGALNVAYGEMEKRGFITLNLTSLAFTLAIILFVLLAIGTLPAKAALCRSSA